MSISSSQPRLLFVDDNVRSIGGHYLELASLLAEGAGKIGYEPHLVSHVALGEVVRAGETDPRLNVFQLQPRFSVRRMENWSLGVDGPSRCQRDIQGRPAGPRFQRLRQLAADRLCRPARRPEQMLQTWSRQFREALEAFAPEANDVVVINTGGDFQILALAHALENFQRSSASVPLQVHVVFHFAVFEDQHDGRAQLFGQQVNHAVKSIEKAGGHQIRLHATTEPLCQQLSQVGVHATAIPYPTRAPWGERNSPRSERSDTKRLKLLLAGLPRVEKGRDEMQRLMQLLEPQHLRTGRYCVSLQCDPKRWQRVIPASMQDLYQQAIHDGECSDDTGLEIRHGNLGSDAYHRWLDSADIGLFLYNPKRYVARCSGVLLEMMIRGAAVVVPDGCWLADQVRWVERQLGEQQLGSQRLGSGAVGWIYQSIDQIPEILDQAFQQFPEVRRNCHACAELIATEHAAERTLMHMGIPKAFSGENVRAA
ncbi:hypothetical protein [Rhodopirellula sp. MGV]|uniref:hypothetical protein n=1 Tax=Rhodopirellula sp. MGV TaxID=2023130 RepID=UPI000B95EE33|nr:hypothetical protein [Rhodopirellula sp. MGV]OYP28943.1 hypothetical protein CGZ80_25600 [Rhodopirellula sp. MGV]PNY36940.1 hypothetical protein C2E31_10005 [Rhodopirellula baltica]